VEVIPPQILLTNVELKFYHKFTFCFSRCSLAGKFIKSVKELITGEPQHNLTTNAINVYYTAIIYFLVVFSWQFISMLYPQLYFIAEGKHDFGKH